MKNTVLQFETIPALKRFFQSKTVELLQDEDRTEAAVVNLYDEIAYQTILGFGGAFTESAAYNYAQLTAEQKREFMESLFSRDKGIGYNFGRMHINSCDFALDIYSYVENGDKTLQTFNIERDKRYIIPMVKDALKYTDEEIFLFASPWSPPAYMKENESPIRGGALKEEYKEVWALYYAKYIQAMAREGIRISAITIQNEPHCAQPWESCSYTPEQERDFIENFLIPALDGEGLSDIKIIIWDHNKERLYDRSKKIFSSEAVYKRVWGIGHHWYSGDHFDALRLAHEQFQKPLISTEICGDIYADVNNLAERYGREMIGDANNFTAAFCDWNLLLSDKGGPFHNRNESTVACAGIVYEDKSSGCFAPILYDTEKKQLIYTPIYYYIGHISKFVQRGARRVATTTYHPNLMCTAFKNPDDTLALVLLNTDERELPVNIRFREKRITISLAPHSVSTFCFVSYL